MKKSVLLSLFLVLVFSSPLLADGRGKGRGHYRDGYAEQGYRWDKHGHKKGEWRRGYGRARGYPSYSYYPAYPAYPPPPPAYGYYSCPPYPDRGSYYRRGSGPSYGKGGRPYPRSGGVRGRVWGEIIF